MQRWFSAVIFLGFTSLVAACDSNPAIFRYLQLSTEKDTDEAIVTDAKQRVITRTTIKGEDALNSNRISPRVITCAEPSPDVAQAISNSITASIGAVIGGGKSVDASFAQATAESIAQLGERIATIQLLRDELSDLCRSYANGAVTATTYTLRLSKLDKKMVTLMIGEMAAGAFGRTLVQINGSAGADTGKIDEAKLNEAQENVKIAQKEVEKHRASLEAVKPEEDADGKKRDEAQKNLTEATKALHATLQVELAIRRGQLEVNAGGAGGFGIGSIARQIQTGDGTTASQMTLIQRQFLEQDDVSTVIDACLTSMDILHRRSALLTQENLSRAQKDTDDQKARIQSIDKELSKISETIQSTANKQNLLNQDLQGLTENKQPVTGLLGNPLARIFDETASEIKTLKEKANSLIKDKEAKIKLLNNANTTLAELKAQEDKIQNALIKQSEEKLLSPLGKYCELHLPELVAAATNRHNSVTDIRKQELRNSETDKQAVLEKVKVERLKAEESTNISAVAAATSQSNLQATRLKSEILVSCRAYMQSNTPANFPQSIREFCDKSLTTLTPP